MTDSPTWLSWKSMIGRCANPKNPDYPEYGGRGITVCERWLKFENFFADMGVRPEGMSLDRYPNVNGNYEPNNCRWATAQLQASNRRSNIYVPWKGAELTISEFARQIGMPRQRVRYWYVKKGLSPEQILAKVDSATHHAS
jgi:hypothetical protein